MRQSRSHATQLQLSDHPRRTNGAAWHWCWQVPRDSFASSAQNDPSSLTCICGESDVAPDVAPPPRTSSCRRDRSVHHTATTDRQQPQQAALGSGRRSAATTEHVHGFQRHGLSWRHRVQHRPGRGHRRLRSLVPSEARLRCNQLERSVIASTQQKMQL